MKVNMILPEYKRVYADTNVVSDICKPDGLMNKFMEKFSLSENILCFSTYTLFEINKNDQLMERFQQFYSIFPCLIISSYFHLGELEFRHLAGDFKEIEPAIISPYNILIDGKKLNPNALKKLTEHPAVSNSFKSVDEYSAILFQEMKTLFDSEEFQGVTKDNCSRVQFINRFKNYELRQRFLAGKKVNVAFDQTKINKMKSLEVLAQGIYYKIYSDSKRRVTMSDIIDVLIMTTAPYTNTFISEGNCIDIYKKIIKNNRSGINNNCLTLSQLRK